MFVTCQSGTIYSFFTDTFHQFLKKLKLCSLEYTGWCGALFANTLCDIYIFYTSLICSSE